MSKGNATFKPMMKAKTKGVCSIFPRLARVILCFIFIRFVMSLSVDILLCFAFQMAGCKIASGKKRIFNQ